MYERNRTIAEKLPATGYVILISLLIIGVGFGLDRLGFYVESGILTAIAVVVLALAVLGQGAIWLLAVLE